MLWIFFLPSLFALAYSCGFQHLKHPPLQHINTASSDSNNERMLQQNYENIRIYADYSNIQFIDSAQRDYIQNQIMPSALSYYQTTLQIIRIPEGLRINTECGGYYPSSSLINPGADADLVILVAAEYLPDVTFVAGAVPCGLSLTDDRPVYGFLLFNLAYLPMDTVTDHQENLSTALHEIAHILGFNSDLYSYFRNPQTGELLTDVVGVRQAAGTSIIYLNVEPLTSRLRTYFSCDAVEGAYLEDEGDSGSAGSHFERRVFMNEFMTASSITEPVISEFTLAVLEGSGWYRPNYNMTEPFNWGRGQGCGFLNSSCVNNQGVPMFDGFCDSNIPIGCSFTSRGVGFCATGYYADFFANSCPYYVSNSQFDCENPENQGSALLSGVSYGPLSRCFTGTLVDFVYQPTLGAYCFPTICIPTETNWILSLNIGNNTINCAVAGPISIEGYNGQLDCPDPNEFCFRANPVYCEKGCSGRGSCLGGRCQCPPGWEGTDCGERIFSLPCERCQNSEEIGCYGDQCLSLDELGLNSQN